MAEHIIKLPDVGEGVAEAELVEWHVKVGDLVREDAVLAAVMTDKATVEIPSPADGEVVWLGVPPSAARTMSVRPAPGVTKIPANAAFDAKPLRIIRPALAAACVFVSEFTRATIEPSVGEALKAKLN